MWIIATKWMQQFIERSDKSIYIFDFKLIQNKAGFVVDNTCVHSIKKYKKNIMFQDTTLDKNLLEFVELRAVISVP